MSSESKFGDCPKPLNSTNTKVSCFDDCEGQDYRWFNKQTKKEAQTQSKCILTIWDFVCLIKSFRCSSALKCCWINNCNRSCVMAENLNRVITLTLPPIPTSVSVVSVEHEARQKAKISWLMRIPHNRCDEHIDYIVEARAHIGNSFSKHKFGQWFVVNTENFHLESMHSHNTKCVYNLLKPQYFYEHKLH